MLEKMEEGFDPEAIINEFESLSMDAERVQMEVLKKILEENGETEYLQQWGLNGRTDPDTFKACVPIVTHSDLEPYIQRIADGEGENSPILTAKPISSISLSSGTTQGKPKYVPFNDELVQSTMQIFKTSFAIRNREYPIGNGKALQFIYSSKQFKTKGGLSAGTATTNVYRDAEFKKTMKAMQTPCCSPDEVIFGDNFNQSLYCHLLSGLIFRDQIQVVSSTFAHSIVHAFRTFEQIWQQLVSDVRQGVLSSHITSRSIRSAMVRLLRPDPELADAIQGSILRLSNWYGLIPELFPNAKYVYGIMTGSMEPYLKKLRHYAGELPLLSADYGSSEGWIGANVNPTLPPESVTFAVLPSIGYYEFMPLDPDGESMSTVGIAGVEIGKEYEVIVTTFAGAYSYYAGSLDPAPAVLYISRSHHTFPEFLDSVKMYGLYRYRLGDVVKVKGFHNSTPELQFVCRRNLLLTINVDKNTEKDLQQSVESAAKLLAAEKLEVIDFTSCVDMSTDPGHYVIFWEISGSAEDDVLEECCRCLDESFVDAGYVSSRKVNGIGALELKILRKGTFQKMMDHFVGLGAAVSQFKTPRCVGLRNKKVLQLLRGNVVKTYFSTAY